MNQNRTHQNQKNRNGRMRRTSLLVATLLLAAFSASCGGDQAQQPAAQQESEQTESRVYFSVPSGFYQDNVNLSMSCPEANARIFYTLDGSLPSDASLEYTQPILLKDRSSEPSVLSKHSDVTAEKEPYVPDREFEKGNVVRAVALLPDGSYSPVTNGTYFVGIDREQLYGQVPVISLITEEANLMDYETGIYVTGKRYDDWIAENPANKYKEGWEKEGNYTMRGRDWERPVYFEYIPFEDTPGYGADLGMRIKGNASRGHAQKSFKLIARGEYGTKRIDYPLIPENACRGQDGIVESYDSIVLRNGGNDADYAKLRDPFLQSLVRDRDFVTQKTDVCVAFINGEYWGLYSLTENYSDFFFASHYGVDKDDVIYVKRGELEEGEEGDLSLYENAVRFIAEHDMTNAANYEKAGKLFDLQSFADYVAFELYIYNEDTLFTWDNNWALWKLRTEDTPWQMVVYDIDYSSGIYEEGGNYYKNNLKDIFGIAGSKDHMLARAFLKLYENDAFKGMFVNAMCDIRNLNFAPARVNAALNEMAPAYKKLGEETTYRFGPDWVVRWTDVKHHTEGCISDMHSFLLGRYDVLPRLMQEAFQLEEAQTLTVVAEASGEAQPGYVLVNESGVPVAEDAEKFKGEYFGEYPVRLTAIPAQGHSFRGWEVTGGEVVSEDGTSLLVKVTSACTVKALFE